MQRFSPAACYVDWIWVKKRLFVDCFKLGKLKTNIVLCFGVWIGFAFCWIRLTWISVCVLFNFTWNVSEKKISAFNNRTIANSILNYAECFGSKPSIVSILQCTMYMVQYIWFVWLGNIAFFRLSITCSEATTFYKVFHKTRLWNEKTTKLECKDWGKTLNAGFKMKSATLIDQIRLQIDKFVQPLKPIQSIQIFIELAFSMKMACSLCSPSLV